MGTAVIACSDASPVLEFSKHIIDLVAFFVEVNVVSNKGVTIFLRRYARRHAFSFQGVSEPVDVIAALGDHLFGFGQEVEQTSRAFVIACLPFG